MTTEPTATTDALREQLAEFRQRADEAENAAAGARAEASRLDGWVPLGRATEEEVAQAQERATAATREASQLAKAIETLQGELAEAEAAEREQRRADLAQQAQAAAKARHSATKRLRNGLSSVRAAFEALDSAHGDAADVRNAIVELHDIDAEEQRIRAKFLAEWEHLKQTAPVAMVPNGDTLERRQEAELKALRERAAHDAASVAPAADDSELRELATAFSDLLPRLVDDETRRDLAAGHEFVTPARSSADFPRGGTGRFFGPGEFEIAQTRYDAFVVAVRRLGGPPAAKIGAEEARYGGVTVTR